MSVPSIEHGSLSAVNPLQLLTQWCRSRLSGLVRIECPLGVGLMWLRAGQVIDCRLETLTGEAAFHCLMGLRRGAYDLQQGNIDRSATIESSTQQLLMRHGYDAETWALLALKLPSLSSLLLLDYRIGEQQMQSLPEEDRRLLELVKKRLTLADVCQESELTALMTLNKISHFLDAGVVRVSASSYPPPPRTSSRPPNVTPRTDGRKSDRPARTTERVVNAPATQNKPRKQVAFARTTVGTPPPKPPVGETRPGRPGRYSVPSAELVDSVLVRSPQPKDSHVADRAVNPAKPVIPKGPKLPEGLGPVTAMAPVAAREEQEPHTRRGVAPDPNSNRQSELSEGLSVDKPKAGRLRQNLPKETLQGVMPAYAPVSTTPKQSDVSSATTTSQVAQQRIVSVGEPTPPEATQPIQHPPEPAAAMDTPPRDSSVVTRQPPAESASNDAGAPASEAVGFGQHLLRGATQAFPDLPAAPKLEPSQRPHPPTKVQISKGKYQTMVVVAPTLGSACFVAAAAAGIGWLSFLGIPLMLAGFAGFVSLTHQMWSAIQDERAPLEPRRAALLLLVPVFNIYWLFRVFPGYASPFNAFLDRYQIQARKLSKHLILAALFVPVAGIVFFWKSVSVICDGINAIGKEGTVF